MVPTFQDGAIVLTLKMPILNLIGRKITRSDIGVFSSKWNQDGLFIKRLVGLPHDELWLDDGRLIVNTRFTTTTSSPNISNPPGPLTCRYTEKFQVPSASFFFMGDNRCNSFDSRSFGAIPMDAIQGVVVGVLFEGLKP